VKQAECCKCGRAPIGVVDANAYNVIARDMLACHDGRLPPERVRLLCWRCSDDMAELDDPARDTAIRALPYPGSTP
jgi:hypothetical protein